MKVAVLLCVSAIVSGELALAAEKPASRNTRARITEPAALDPAAVNDPNVWQMQHRGAATLRAQILLDRAHFSPGEIDAAAGANFTRAIAAFQESRSIAASGKLDEPTWQALNADTAPVLVPYKISQQDVAGPFSETPKDLVEQSKLQALSFGSAQEALGETFHIRPSLLEKLNRDKKLDADQEILVPNVLGNVSGKAAQIVVSKAGSVQAIDTAGKVIAHYPSTSGSEKDPLPVGQWKINGVARNPPFHYNPDLFWDADPKHSKAKIPPGPNNPVGIVWIDLSKEHYGIHGTPEPSKVGHTQSHGCIRLTNWDAAELATLVAPGVPAILKD